MRGILINPYLETVTLVNGAFGDLDNIYQTITEPEKHVVDTLTVVLCSPGVVLYLDDNGHLEPGRVCWSLMGYPTPLAGKGLLLGVNAEGENCDLPAYIQPHAVRRAVSWLRMVSTGRFGETTEGYINHPVFGRTKAIIQGAPKLKYPEEEQ